MLAVNDQWPLYLVTASDLYARLPLARAGLVLVTSSFGFTRFLVRYLRKVDADLPWDEFSVLRVTNGNRMLDVRLQKPEYVFRLDHRYSKPPTVTEEACCQLCMHNTMIHSIYAGFNPPAYCSKQVTHERLHLHEVNKEWKGSTAESANALQSALQSARNTWMGVRYFAIGMRSRLPPEIVERITICVLRQQ